MARENLDIIVVEGLHSSIGQQPGVFKIVTAHDDDDLEQKLQETIPPILAISGVIASKGHHIMSVDVPVLDSRGDCQELVRLVENILI